MARLKLAALAALLAGLALLLYGALRGDVRVALLLIIPVVYAQGLAPALGMLLLMAAMVLWFVARVRESAAAPGEAFSHADWGEQPHRGTRSGGVMLLGPIPIVWGSDRKILPWMVAAGLALLVLALLFTLARR